MNTRKVITISIVTVLALAALGGGIAFAQANRPGWGMSGYGPGGMMGGYGAQNGGPGSDGMMSGNGGSGMMGGADGYGGHGLMGGDGAGMQNMHEWAVNGGGMHTLVWNGIAEALNLTPDELNTQLASGKTLVQIAEEKGVSREQLAAALETSVKAGLAQAVTDGVLTQEQADQMLNQMGGNFGWMLDHMGSGVGPGGCHAGTDFAPQPQS